LPRKKKAPMELTTEEAMKKLFPKKVVEEVKKVVSEEPSERKSKDMK
jgi:hypothetical protein